MRGTGFTHHINVFSCSSNRCVIGGVGKDLSILLHCQGSLKYCFPLSSMVEDEMLRCISVSARVPKTISNPLYYSSRKWASYVMSSSIFLLMLCSLNPSLANQIQFTIQGMINGVARYSTLQIFSPQTLPQCRRCRATLQHNQRNVRKQVLGFVRQFLTQSHCPQDPLHCFFAVQLWSHMRLDATPGIARFLGRDLP